MFKIVNLTRLEGKSSIVTTATTDNDAKLFILSTIPGAVHIMWIEHHTAQKVSIQALMLHLLLISNRMDRPIIKKTVATMNKMPTITADVLLVSIITSW